MMLEGKGVMQTCGSLMSASLLVCITLFCFRVLKSPEKVLNFDYVITVGTMVAGMLG